MRPPTPTIPNLPFVLTISSPTPKMGICMALNWNKFGPLIALELCSQMRRLKSFYMSRHVETFGFPMG
jgi:hypothetical protein